MELFPREPAAEREPPADPDAPLAERMRPREVEAFEGQAHLLGADGPLGPMLSDHRGARFHIAGRLEIDEWGGRKRPKLRLEDAARPV